ncbi:MAG: molybdopterin dinucleotide binding domain-containing protein [Promethearchaeota archaeon]
MGFILNTIRDLSHDQLREFALGDDLSLFENVAIAFFNPDDFKRLRLSENSNVKLSTKYGEIVVKCKASETIPPNTITMPVSIWANQITGTENATLIYKNISVFVEKTNESVLTLDQILNKLKEGGK